MQINSPNGDARSRQSRPKPMGDARANNGPSRRKPPRRQEPAPQISFPAPFPVNPHVAIVGGGFSGLVCAHELVRQGIRTTIFDTGEHGVGGRLGTRTSRDQSLRDYQDAMLLEFDHAAQFFTASDSFFEDLVQGWERGGAVARWDGLVMQYKDGIGRPLDLAGHKYIAASGMRQLAEHLLSQIRRVKGGVGQDLVALKRPCWISDMEFTGDAWNLLGKGTTQGQFDFVVIAHNGKCANRLALPSGAPKVARQLTRLKLSSVWVAMVAFGDPVKHGLEMEGAFIEGDPILSWIGNNTAKLRLDLTSRQTAAECWTLISTPQYGKANKVPQEFVPVSKDKQVRNEMVEAFRKLLGLEESSLPEIVFSKAQLWGAALPVNSPKVPCIMDPVSHVGVCGDWLLGASMQDAAISGAQMAYRIAQARGMEGKQLEELELGLHSDFRSLSSTAIGDFPQKGQDQPAKDSSMYLSSSRKTSSRSNSSSSSSSRSSTSAIPPQRHQDQGAKVSSIVAPLRRPKGSSSAPRRVHGQQGVDTSSDSSSSNSGKVRSNSSGDFSVGVSEEQVGQGGKVGSVLVPPRRPKGSGSAVQR